LQKALELKYLMLQRNLKTKVKLLEKHFLK